MTNQEAIDVIDSSPLFWFRVTDQEREALWMATEALRKQSSTEVEILCDGMPLVSGTTYLH